MGLKKRPRSKFEQWVLEVGGAEKLSAQLKITPGAVWHWCSRRRTPNALLCEKILGLAKGKLSLSDIVKGTSHQ